MYMVGERLNMDGIPVGPAAGLIHHHHPQHGVGIEQDDEVIDRKPIIKPHPCTRCAKSFSSVHQLAQHTRVHTGEKPYKCSFCERRFKQQSHVKQHTRLHTGERPYRCQVPLCGRSFVQLSNLQQHMGTHSTEMEKAKNQRFHCTVCGKGFASESSLHMHHEKKHHQLLINANQDKSKLNRPRPHQCNTCGKGYTTHSALQIHSLKHLSSSPADQDNEGSRNNGSDVPTTASTPAPTPSPASASTNNDGSGGSFNCPSCTESFVTADGLAEHVRVAHNPQSPRPHYPPLPFCPPSGGPPNVPWFSNHPHHYGSPHSSHFFKPYHNRETNNP